MCLLGICVSSLEKNISLDPLLMFYLSFFMMLSHMNSLYFFGINLLSNTSFANILSHSVSCLFTLVIQLPLLCKSFLVWCSAICFLLFLNHESFLRKKTSRLSRRDAKIYFTKPLVWMRVENNCWDSAAIVKECLSSMH